MYILHLNINIKWRLLKINKIEGSREGGGVGEKTEMKNDLQNLNTT